MRKKWIRPSISLIRALILFVLKKDRGLRLCVNYYNLNKITIKNRHPLPLINKTLDRLIEAVQFTKLNFKDIYYQIRIRESN